MQAVSAGTVRSKHYSQALSGGAWTATQNGTMYYTGTGGRVWVTQSYQGYQGSHRCFVNYSVGFSVSLQGCYDTGDTITRRLEQSYYVQPAKLPVGWSAGSVMYAHSSGNTSY